MKRSCSIIVCFLVFSLSNQGFGQAIFMSEAGTVTFFSKAPLEDIDASSDNINSFINTINNEIVFIIPIKSFKFKKSLMQEHFNEKYMESDRYPNAQYKGKINQNIDLSKDSTYSITCTGVLSLHGIDQTRSDSGTMVVKNGKMSLMAGFNVACSDHKIEIPKLVIQNIASVVKVNLNANYIPYKKNESK